MENNPNIEIATFGGGCFWCIETIFNRVKGVIKAESGYAGGIIDNPTYEEVCSGKTQHVEVVQVTFDKSIISYIDLLKIFFKIHNPTQLNRQGEDIGDQYRSVIFYHHEEQQRLATEAIHHLEISKIWNEKIVTAVEPISNYYPAELYHQDYFNLNKEKNSYCILVVAPKVEKFESAFAELMK